MVYEAVRPEGVAVKLLAEDIRRGESERYRRFRAEYLNLVRLVPTGRLVPLYQFGVVDVDEAWVPYILMERCTETLKHQLRADPIRTAEAFVGLLDELLASLEVVHAAGIVHRDLKPENVLVRPNGDRVLADFGISWFDPARYDRDVETKGGDRLGNFAFSAPEQVRRDQADPSPAMDYYALGQVLYWSVTGSTIRGTAHVPLRSVARPLGRFDPLVEALVSHDPAARPETPAAIRALIDPPEKDPEEERYWAMRKAQDAFDDALSRGLPGSWGPTPIPMEKLDRVLREVASVCEGAGLYLLTKRGESGACPMRKDGDVWVIGGLRVPSGRGLGLQEPDGGAPVRPAAAGRTVPVSRPRPRCTWGQRRGRVHRWAVCPAGGVRRRVRGAQRRGRGRPRSRAPDPTAGTTRRRARAEPERPRDGRASGRRRA